MATAFDYGITQLYGYDKAYGGVHTGVDYGAPEGTPIVVNGVCIGLVGWTGKVYDAKGQRSPAAAHLHVSRVVGGSTVPINPQDGRNVSGARVSQISEDATNGKFVRLQDADGSSWVYCHMSNNNVVKVGDVLSNLPQYNKPKEEDMPDLATADDVVNLYQELLDRTPDQATINTRVGSKQTLRQVQTDIFASGEYKDLRRINPGDLANLKAKGITGVDSAINKHWKKAYYENIQHGLPKGDASADGIKYNQVGTIDGQPIFKKG